MNEKFTLMQGMEHTDPKVTVWRQERYNLHTKHDSHKIWNTTRLAGVPGTEEPHEAAETATALNCQWSVHCITTLSASNSALQ
jgi:hypothetical protein